MLNHADQVCPQFKNAEKVEILCEMFREALTTDDQNISGELHEIIHDARFLVAEHIGYGAGFNELYCSQIHNFIDDFLVQLRGGVSQVDRQLARVFLNKVIDWALVSGLITPRNHQTIH